VRQEDFNDMMRLPWEVPRANAKLPKCPKCDESYCGDGKCPCLECTAELARTDSGHSSAASRFESCGFYSEVSMIFSIQQVVYGTDFRNEQTMAAVQLAVNESAMQNLGYGGMLGDLGRTSEGMAGCRAPAFGPDKLLNCAPSWGTAKEREKATRLEF